MNKMITVVIAALAFTVCAEEMSLSDARAQIGAIASDPSLVTATMKKLSADDQKSFLAELNAAIATMPGSVDAKGAIYLNANKAMLKSAKTGNLSVLLAEVFATVPVEYLPLLSESFASDLFNRAASVSKSYTDEQFTRIATEMMDKISARDALADASAVRDTFALLMFLRASNGSPTDLTDTLITKIPNDYRMMAKDEWIPAAMGPEKSYEGLLAAANVDLTLTPTVALRIAGPQSLDALLMMLDSTVTHGKGFLASPQVSEQVLAKTVYEDLPGVAERAVMTTEPRGYQWQD